MLSPSRTLTALFQDDELGHCPQGFRLREIKCLAQSHTVESGLQFSSDAEATCSVPAPTAGRSVVGGGGATCCTWDVSCAQTLAPGATGGAPYPPGTQQGRGNPRAQLATPRSAGALASWKAL